MKHQGACCFWYIVDIQKGGGKRGERWIQTKTIVHLAACFFSGLEKIGYIGHKIVQGDQKKKWFFTAVWELQLTLSHISFQHSCGHRHRNAWKTTWNQIHPQRVQLHWPPHNVHRWIKIKEFRKYLQPTARHLKSLQQPLFEKSIPNNRRYPGNGLLTRATLLRISDTTGLFVHKRVISNY